MLYHQPEQKIITVNRYEAELKKLRTDREL